jgi:hypothetical protein
MGDSGGESRDHRARRAFFAAAWGLGAAAAAVVFFFFLGAVTGVLSSCSWAPEWWGPAFAILFLIGVPSTGVAAAIRSWRHQRRI